MTNKGNKLTSYFQKEKVRTNDNGYSSCLLAFQYMLFIQVHIWIIKRNDDIQHTTVIYKELNTFSTAEIIQLRKYLMYLWKWMLVTAFDDFLYVSLLYSGTIKSGIGIQQSTHLQKIKLHPMGLKAYFLILIAKQSWNI